MKAQIAEYVNEKYNGKNKSMLVAYVAMVWMMTRDEAKTIVEEIIAELA